jgi:hypothetical protein
MNQKSAPEVQILSACFGGGGVHEFKREKPAL